MSLDYINSKKISRYSGTIPLVTSLPNLVEGQERSYDKFLQLKNACKAVDGTFTLLWHNNQLTTKAERDLYTSIIK